MSINNKQNRENKYTSATNNLHFTLWYRQKEDVNDHSNQDNSLQNVLSSCIENTFPALGLYAFLQKPEETQEAGWTERHSGAGTALAEGMDLKPMVERS